MEFKEVCQERFEGRFYGPFSLSSCWSKDNCYALIGSGNSEGVLLEIQNIHDTKSERMNILWIVLTPSKQTPTLSIIQKTDMLSIYNKSSLPEKQNLVIDPRYSIEFGKLQFLQITCVSWPPKNTLFAHPIVAVVNNLGACEIFTRNQVNTEYTDPKIYINDLLKDIFYHNPNETPRTIQQLQNIVEDLCISYCCWDDFSKDSQSLQLFCATESGWIISFKVIQWNAEFCCKIKTDLKCIKQMKIFKYEYEGIQKTFLFTADVRGILKLFEMKTNELSEISTLWSKEDKMLCQSPIINHCKNIGKFLVVTTKSSHLLAFILAPNGKICEKAHHYVGNYMITGLHELKPFEYILCTVNGYIEHVIVSLKGDNLHIQNKSINHNLPIDNNQILGMIATPNKVGWLFALYRNKAKKKTYGYLSVNSLNVIEPLDILLKAHNQPMEDYTDCAEIIRLKLMNDIQTADYSKLNLDKVVMNEEFMHTLRIRRIIVTGIDTFNRKNFNIQNQSTEKELIDIENIISALYICDRLQYLKHENNLTNFQIVSITYMRKILTDFLKLDLSEPYEHIKKVVTPIVEYLLLESSKLNYKQSPEKCVYCLEDIILSTMACKNNHNLPRCCISLVQIIFTRRHCPQCKRVALEDDSLLFEILGNSKKISCPFCAVSFIIETHD